MVGRHQMLAPVLDPFDRALQHLGDERATRAIAGDERPKQFCPILNNETLLDKTRERAALGINPENTYFSLTEKHEIFYRSPLAAISEDQLVIQPENKGTAPAILYSLLRIARTNPKAKVAFFPSDHYFSDDVAFMDHVEKAFDVVEMNSDSIVLLGIEPEKAETSYGWIEPVQSLFGGLSKAVSRVKCFWEKPEFSTAQKLMKEGALWNSFVMVGAVETFLGFFEKHLPELYWLFDDASVTFGTAAEERSINSLYKLIGEINFSSEVLEKVSEELLVMRVGEVGWSDWGEPQRVLGTLSNLGVKPEWIHAVAA